MGGYFRLYSRMKKFIVLLGLIISFCSSSVFAAGTVASLYVWKNSRGLAVANPTNNQDVAFSLCRFAYPRTSGAGVYFKDEVKPNPFPAPPQTYVAVECKLSELYNGNWYPPYFTSSGAYMYTDGTMQCPVNSSGTSTCTCNTGYQPNAGATACEVPACPVVGTTAGAYWIVAGSQPDSIYSAGLGAFCKGSCQVKSVLTIPRPAGYPSSDGALQIVGGVRQFYTFREYEYTGASCTGGDTQPVAGAVPAAATCAANQSMIQMGTRIKCIDPSTGQEANPNSASAVAAAKTLADSKAAKAIQDAKDAFAAAGGSASDVVAAGTVAAGVVAGGGFVGGAVTGFSPNDPMNAFCVENPQSSICKEQIAGGKPVTTAALSGLYTDGTLTNSKTVSGVVGSFKNRVLSSGIGTAAGGFFTVNQAAGSCPVWSANIPLMGTLSFDFYCQSTFQDLLPWIKSVLLLIFSVIAFRIAIL